MTKSVYHKGDLQWYRGLLLYCEGRIGKFNVYLFTDPWGGEYKLTELQIELSGTKRMHYRLR